MGRTQWYIHYQLLRTKHGGLEIRCLIDDFKRRGVLDHIVYDSLKGMIEGTMSCIFRILMPLYDGLRGTHRTLHHTSPRAQTISRRLPFS
jgi:hypothetical protein